MSSEQMYQDIILDHFRNPKNKGLLKDGSIARDVNTSCGDEITFSLKITKGTIVDAQFEGKGCAISQAAASMLTEMVIGKHVSEAVAMDKQVMLDSLNVPISGMRLKCALLGFKVMKMAIVAEEHKK